MNRLNLTCLLVLSAFGISSPLLAQSPVPNVERSDSMAPNATLSTNGSWIGYLIDTKSMEENRAASVPDAESVRKPLRNHEAVLSNQKAEFALYCNGKFLLLDDAGNTEARKFLKHSWKKEKFYVLVKGGLQDGRIQVRQISDASDSPM
jgi:hypothetical protein